MDKPIIKSTSICEIQTFSGRTITQSFDKTMEWCRKNQAKLQNNKTYHEKKLYDALPRSVQKGVRKQPIIILDNHVIFPDLLFFEKRAIVEIDGGYHNTEERHKKDVERDCICTNNGLRVFRITNDAIDNASSFVEIVKMLNSLTGGKGEYFDVNARELHYLANPDVLNTPIRRTPLFEYAKRGKCYEVRLIKRK